MYDNVKFNPYSESLCDFEVWILPGLFYAKNCTAPMIDDNKSQAALETCFSYI